jgi:hypothetical protein
MEDMAQYLDTIVEPTIIDFESNPTSVRHAFLACVATFHAIDYLAYPNKTKATLRQKFGKQSPDFLLTDHLAHAFKHVVVGRHDAPHLKAQEVISRPPAFWGDDSVGGVTLDKDRKVDLLVAIRRTVAFLRKQKTA